MTIKLCFWRSFCNATHKENCGRLSHLQVLENAKSQELPGALPPGPPPGLCPGPAGDLQCPTDPQLVWAMTYGHCRRDCDTQHLKEKFDTWFKKNVRQVIFPLFRPLESICYYCPWFWPPWHKLWHLMIYPTGKQIHNWESQMFGYLFEQIVI